jgi:hypothetical protein
VSGGGASFGTEKCSDTLKPVESSLESAATRLELRPSSA